MTFGKMGGMVFAIAACLLGGCAAQHSVVMNVTDDCRVLRQPRSGSADSPGMGVGVGMGAGVGSSSAGGSGVSPNSDCGRACSERGGHSSSSVGVGVGIDLGKVFDALRQPDLARQLLELGPGLAPQFSMNCLPVRGFVKGGWPMVVDYVSNGAGDPVVELHLEDRDQPLVFPLDKANGRHFARFELPGSLGGSPRPALVLVRANGDRGGTAARGSIQLFGLGAGPRAVGSVAIEQVDFLPPTLRRSAQQKASYSFHAKSDFNRVAVEVLQVRYVDNQIRVGLARAFRFEGGVSRDTWFGRGEARTWDGTDARNQASLGSHLLQVRAWATAREDGDWVTAWSAAAVEVLE